MSRIFVTSSGTEIGKTFVSCTLIRQLRKGGLGVHALKPVMTGYGPEEASASDTGLLMEALDREITPEGVAGLSPWRFSEPLSPDMAAAREGTSIPFDELVAFCEADYGAEVVLIEGIGGVMVPLDSRHTVLDWIVALGAPALLVVGSYLGTLSHTLTAAGQLAARDVELAGIVVNESEEQPVPVEETAEVVARFVSGVPVQVLKRVATPDDAPDLRPLIAPYL